MPRSTSPTTPGRPAYRISDVRTTLNDAVGSAGVDLQEEEDYLHQQSQCQGSAYTHTEDRTREQALRGTFDSAHILTQMNIHASKHKVTISDDAVLYFSLALRARMHGLVTNMVEAARHRTETQHRPSFVTGTPLWKMVIRNDVGKVLDALERVDRAEHLEWRQRLAMRNAAERQAQAMLAQRQADLLKPPDLVLPFTNKSDGTPKTPTPKREKGPGYIAKHMSQDMRTKLANTTANKAAGINARYSWMSSAGSTPGAGSSLPTTPVTPRRATRHAPQTPVNAEEEQSESESEFDRSETLSETETPSEEEDERPTLSLTMRDALFVISKERGHGGGRGAGYGYGYASRR